MGQRYRYVAVEGVIGVGKTTLVHRLAEALEGRAVLEAFDENPFLPDFYRDRDAHALSTQLFFLMSRYRQQQVLAQGDLFQVATISDYIFDKDRLFALLTLSPDELGVYDRLYTVLRPQVPTPDLVIFLKAEHELVMERIAHRGRPYEKDMDGDYIQALAQTYLTFFQSYRTTPILTIDTSKVDFREDTPVQEVVDMLSSGRVPRTLAAELRVGDPQPSLPGLDATDPSRSR